MSRMFGAAVVVGVAFMIAGCQQATGQEPLMDALIGETTAVFAEEGFAPFDSRRTGGLGLGGSSARRSTWRPERRTGSSGFATSTARTST